MKNFYRFLSIVLFFSGTNFCIPEKQPVKTKPTMLSKEDINTFTFLAHKLTEGKACLQDCEKLQKILDTACQLNCALQETSQQTAKLNTMLVLTKQQHSKKSCNP